MDSIRLDLRFAVRAVVARPGVSALAVLTLAIGIGVNAVAFSAINALLFKPTSFPGFDTLGWITTQEPGNPYAQTSWPDYQDISRSSTAFESIAAGGRMPLSMRDGSTARQIWALVASINYFATLRTRPALGRLFTESDLNTTEVAVMVSQRFWKESLGGGDNIAGRTLILNGRVTSIVGVIPDGFQGPGGFFEPDVWVPLDRMAVLNMPDRLASRSEPWLGLVGRLRPGVTPGQALSELQARSSALAVEYPATHKNRTLAFTPMADGNPEVRRLAPLAYLALAIVSLVLLIACFNVAGLLLARAAERQREISVRSALGAGRARIVRQFAIEGLLLAVLSGAAAVVISVWSADLLTVFSLPSPIPQRLHIRIDRRLIGFVAALVAFAGVLPTLLPAFQATRADLVRSMRAETTFGQSRSRARGLFIIAQIAGSTLFLATALLFVRGFVTSANSDPGFETKHLLVMELKPADYGYDPPRARALFDNLLTRLRADARVQHAAIGDRVSFYVGFPKLTRISIDGTDCAVADCRTAFVYGVGTGYFHALGVPLRAGRDFTLQEIEGANVAIVSETMAIRLWPGRTGVGEWIREGREGRHLQVIGIAADITHHGFGESPAEYLYRPLRAAEYADVVTVVIRTLGESRLFVASVQEQLRSLDPNLPPASLKTMEQRMELPLWPIRTAAGFFLICGALALVLATVGLFGMTYLAVNQRTREFGIRTALGATRTRMMRLILGEGLQMTLPGIALGLGAAIVAGRLLASTFFRISAVDPSTYAAAALLEVLVALAACLIPAQRATTSDPIVALRSE